MMVESLGRAPIGESMGIMTQATISQKAVPSGVTKMDHRVDRILTIS